jgi:hypothetical protein
MMLIYMTYIVAKYHLMGPFGQLIVNGRSMLISHDSFLSHVGVGCSSFNGEFVKTWIVEQVSFGNVQYLF